MGSVLRNVIGRKSIAIVVIALASGLATTLPPFSLLHGWSIEILTALRWRAFGPRRDAATSPVAVIAIDEETYDTPPFKGSPTPTWTTEVGRVLAAVLDGGAKVAGFDVVFADSIELSEIPFGDASLGSRMRGFDRPFLLSLRAGASAGKVVLGEILRDQGSLGPSAGQRIAVGQQKNIRSLNIYSDPDEVVRRVPLTFLGVGAQVPSMALELAARAQKAEPVFADDGSVTLAGYRIPSAVQNTLTLNFDGGTEDFQTFSLADLRACVERNDQEFFRRHFADRVVIFGTLLDELDRKQTSKRFATGLERSAAPRCAPAAAPSPAARFGRSSIAGVYIHATAVSNLLFRDALVELGRQPTTILAIGFALLIAIAARRLAPATAASVYLAMVGLWTLCATIAFERLVLPLSEPFIAGLASLAMMIAYRLVVTDRGQRLLRRSFALYLAPQVIDKMLASNKLPVLGGETREVTVFFSDLAGFSAMAVFGAPVDDADHARNAALAALGCRDRLDELNQNSTAFRGHQAAHRMGLNSGEALVGNIGSRRRFNYSVMSDAVNVASRLEGANKYYGTTIIASETTVALTGSTFTWRELDATRVKGRTSPVKIYELVAVAGEGTPQQREAAAAYAEGLAHWQSRAFEAAATCFARAAEFDKPSALFLNRANQFASHPPGPDWEPVSSLESK
jgi:adenylate cyclase